MMREHIEEKTKQAMKKLQHNPLVSTGADTCCMMTSSNPAHG
jgi:hypothetical protein